MFKQVIRRGDRSDGIDLLRGFFAFWVLLAHLIPWTVLVQGDLSVPLILQEGARVLVRLFQSNREVNPAVLGFIVLSGYCIHRNGFRIDNISLSTYALRRFFRIMPVFIVATLIGILAFYYAVSLNEKWGKALSGTSEISIMAVFLKLTGIGALIPASYPGTYAGNAPLQTVMAEIMLYAVYPLFFLISLRWGTKWIWILCGITFLIGLLFAHQSDDRLWSYLWWQNGSVFGFLIYWWIGALLVSDKVYQSLIPKVWIIGLSWVVLTALILGFEFGPIMSEFRKISLALLIALFVAALDKRQINLSRWISAPGRFGYSLYAFHAPLCYVLVISNVSFWIIILANLVVAAGFYAVLEKPMLNLGYKLSKPNKARIEQ